MMRRAAIAGVVASLIGTLSVSAQTTTSDIQAWPSVAVTASVTGRLEIRADGLLQITDDVSRVGRELGRVVIVGEVNEHLALGGGYTWTRVEDRAGKRVVEHRAVQQVDVRIPVARDASVVSSRTRLEERYQEREAAMALRLREQIRLDVPVAGRGVSAVVWSEYFHSINRTAWSGRSGPALVLTFVGLRIPVNRHATIEPGYLNQTNIVAGRNQARHAVAVLFAVRLPHS
jgi:hypothetical protein